MDLKPHIDELESRTRLHSEFVHMIKILFKYECNDRTMHAKCFLLLLNNVLARDNHGERLGFVLLHNGSLLNIEDLLVQKDKALWTQYKNKVIKDMNSILK